MKLLIKNGHLVCSETNLDKIADIVVIDGKISEIGENIKVEDIEGEVKVMDASGLHVLPGLVDAHCHLREPGQEYKEDIESGTKSAAAGGFTSIACMPNTNPVVDNKAIVSYIKTIAKEKGVVNVYPIAAISKGMKGEELSEMGDLKEAGAIAVSDDGKPVSNPALMKKALQYAAMFNLKVISHCEDQELADEGVMNEGYTSTILGLKGIPAAAEEVMVSREVILAEYLELPVHIAHVSTEQSIDIIRRAKSRGVQVTAETCPHYFSLTEEAVLGFNTLAKVNPPLRIEKDLNAVIEGLKDGTIDMIATDHAPHHKDEKNVEFALAANGFVGFETAFSLGMTHLVKAGHLTINDLVNKMCAAPAKMLNLPKGTLQIGADADMAIVDIHKEYVVDINRFKSKSKNSPYNGHKLTGSIQFTVVSGKVVYEG